MYETLLQSLNDVLAQHQTGKVQLTDSQVNAINAQINMVREQMNELLKASGMQIDSTNSAQQTITQAEQLVSALQALPTSIKTKIGYEGVFNALLTAMMNGNNMELAQAALDKAKAGIQAALKNPSLDAGTRAALEGLLGEIDSGAGVRDNRYNQSKTPSNPDEYREYASEIGKRNDLNIEQKVKLLQDAYYALEEGNKTNVRCPADARFVKGFNEDGLPIYNWPKLWGFVKNSIKSITRGELNLPNRWSRVGSFYGNSLSDIPANGTSYTNNERSLPDIENIEAEHQGTARQDDYYFDVIDAIANNDLNALNALLNLNGYPGISEKTMDRLIATYSDFIENAKERIGDIVDAKYGLFGIVAPWVKDGNTLLDGGAKQYTLPLSIQQLIDLGIFQNTRRNSV